MKKLLHLPFLILLLVACNSVPSGIDESLYNDGKEIIQMTVDNVNSNKVRFTKEQTMKIDNFTSKYTSGSKKLSKKEFEFYQLIFWTQISYRSYGGDQETKYLDKYHESLDKLKTKFNIEVD